MVSKTLTNIITNGGFEVNAAGWLGSATTLTRVAVPTPVHGETGSWCLQHSFTVNNNATGVFIYVRSSAAGGSVTLGNKYYIRARVRAQANVNGCELRNGVNNVSIGHSQVALTQNVWTLVDFVWTADTSSFNIYFLMSGALGNLSRTFQIDNVLMVDLTTPFGAGKEPTLQAIRDAVNGAGHHWDSSKVVSFPDFPDIIVKSLALALKGREYSDQVSLVSGSGSSPFHFSLSGLPSGHGLLIDDDGVLSDVCGLSEGQYPFNINVVDFINFQDSKQFTLDVKEPPIIHDRRLPIAELNKAYSFTPNVSGSADNLVVTVSVINGVLPTGLSISGTTISGTPTVNEQGCEIEVTADNDYETGHVKRFRLEVASAPIIKTTSPLPSVRRGTYFEKKIIASAMLPVMWEFLSGALPPGVSFNESGVVIENFVKFEYLNMGVVNPWTDIAYCDSEFFAVTSLAGTTTALAPVSAKGYRRSVNRGDAWAAPTFVFRHVSMVYDKVCLAIPPPGSRPGNVILLYSSTATSGNIMAAYFREANGTDFFGVAVAGGPIRKIIYGQGQYFVLRNSVDLGYITTPLSNLQVTALPGRLPSNDWKNLYFGHGLFIAISDSRSGDRIATSVNPMTTNFTVRVDPVKGPWKDVCWGKDKFIVIGFTDDYVMSDDGITWTAGKLPLNCNWKLISHDGVADCWVVLSEDGHLLFSHDGEYWVVGELPEGTWNGLVSNGQGTWIAVSSTGDKRVVRITLKGRLPEEYEVADDNLLYGIPTVPGSYSFTLKVSNSLGQATRQFDLEVYEPNNDLFLNGKEVGRAWMGGKEIDTVFVKSRMTKF